MNNIKKISDSTTQVQDLKDYLRAFCEERDWGQFHSAKDLAIGAVTEASELLEPFRFLTEAQVDQLMKDPEAREHLGDELADVLFFIVRFAQKFDYDLSEVFYKKMQKNAKRYPAAEFRGRNQKAEN